MSTQKQLLRNFAVKRRNEIICRGEKPTVLFNMKICGYTLRKKKTIGKKKLMVKREKRITRVIGFSSKERMDSAGQMGEAIFVGAVSGDSVSGGMKGSMVPDAGIGVVVVVGA